jgi:hypothetical protein
LFALCEQFSLLAIEASCRVSNSLSAASFQAVGNATAEVSTQFIDLLDKYRATRLARELLCLSQVVLSGFSDSSEMTRSK